MPFELPGPPRSVRLRNRSAVVGIWFARVFALPHTAVGLGLTAFTAVSLYATVLGQDVEAVVKAGHTSRSKGSTRYQFDLEYEADGERHTTSVGASKDDYAALISADGSPNKATTRTVRRLSVLGYEHSHADGADSMGLLCLGPFALFWNALVATFLYAVWVRPIRERLLIRHGAQVRGKVVSATEVRGKGTTYRLTFEFLDDLSLSSLGPGSELRVIYDPRRPRRAIAYDFSNYRVEGDEFR
jgi:hypothetical protein